jgi:hypothetical protein
VVDVSSPRAGRGIGLGAILAQVAQADRLVVSAKDVIRQFGAAPLVSEACWRVDAAHTHLTVALSAAGSPVIGHLGRPKVLGRTLEATTGAVAMVVAWLIGEHGGGTIAAGLIAGLSAAFPVYAVLVWLDRAVGRRRADDWVADATAGAAPFAVEQPVDLGGVQSRLMAARDRLAVAAISYVGRSTDFPDLAPDVRQIRLATVDRVLMAISTAEIQLTAAVAVLGSHLAGRDE